MASKRKRESVDDVLSSPAAKQSKQEEVTRSGRVRKKPAKFVEVNLEETDVTKRLEMEKVVQSATQSILAHVVSSPPPQPKVVTIDVPEVQEEVVIKEEMYLDEDGGKTPGRTGRSRKKSAKLLEMEEFEEAEKKQFSKKDAAKKLKTPTSPVFLNQKTVTIQKIPTSPVKSSKVTKTLTSPISTIKIKDIQTVPKVETTSPISIHISPQKKTPMVESPKSPLVMSSLSSHSPENKGSVIKLLLSSPAQSAAPIISNTASQLSPPLEESSVTSKKKTRVKEKVVLGSTEENSKIKQVLGMPQQMQVQSGMAALKQPLKINTSIVKSEFIGNEGLKMSFVQEHGDSGIDSSTVKLEPLSPTASKPTLKETKPKKNKKSAVKDESVFLAPPMPSPNVIHVGPMNVGLEMKHEVDTVMKKKKTKLKIETQKQKQKERLDMAEEMMGDEYGLDMSEIELGEPGDDSFMDIDDDDSLIMPDEDLVSMKPKSGKSLKKKNEKSGMKGSIQLGDIPDTDLVMDFARMKADKVEEKKKKKQVKETSTETEKVTRKKKRAPTAYMLWCYVNRPRVVADNPGINFSSISKTLGEMWSTLSEKDKMLWKRKAKKAAGKGSTLITTGKVAKAAVLQSSGSTVPRQGVAGTTRTTVPQVTPAVTTIKQAKIAVDDGSPPVKGFSNDPVDVAAHLKIVGESLSIIGMRLQEHRGLIAVQGSLSVLLDSMLCAVAPLMCLTSVLPETNGLPYQTHMKNLDNIAYIMPGL